MIVGGRALRPIRALAGRQAVEIIDQRALPHRLEMRTLATLGEALVAIRDMWVRGAPLIGATAAYGMALAAGATPAGAPSSRRPNGCARRGRPPSTCPGRCSVC